MDDLRLCPQCGNSKPRTDFYRKSRVCKSCAIENSKKYYAEHVAEITAYKRKYYRDNPDKVAKHRANQKDNARIAEQRKREKLFALYDEVKTPCAKCGETRLYIIEFHHINPGEKERTISQMRNLDKVREEVKKCVCLCANCHREFHHFYGIRPADPVNALKEYLGRELNDG